MSKKSMTRREFVKNIAGAGVVCGGVYCLISTPRSWRSLLGSETVHAAAETTLDQILKTAPKARYWLAANDAKASCGQCHDDHTAPQPTACHGAGYQHPDGLVKCLLCAKRCAIKAGERGTCRARMNVNGELRTLVYGHPVAIHIDPIEKKPFYHFLPGAEAYSMGTAGCPLHCKFCQNWEISQSKPEDHNQPFLTPEEIGQQAKSSGAPIIAFTYNEPSIFIEYLTDIARLGKQSGFRTVLVSCGFMNQEPLTELCECLDAVKIDLKGFSEDFYKNVSSAALQPVLRSIKQISQSGKHLELVNLVVPTLNDSDAMLRELVAWIVGEIGIDVPIHFTRFHPDYQLRNLPSTPVATLERARAFAMEKGIHYAYVGNVPGHEGNHTYCPSCHKVVIRRSGFFTVEKNLAGNRCAFCNEPIAGVWS